MAQVRTLRVYVAALLEPLVKLIAVVATWAGRNRFGFEMALRGWVLGGAQRWRIGRRVEFNGQLDRISLGRNVVLYGDNWLDASGAFGRITIGDETHVDRQTILYGLGGLSIGSNCAIASGVRIYSQS